MAGMPRVASKPKRSHNVYAAPGAAPEQSEGANYIQQFRVDQSEECMRAYCWGRPLLATSQISWNESSNRLLTKIRVTRDALP
eukprot:1136816-Pelagomonas_calceolata.AAC.4